MGTASVIKSFSEPRTFQTRHGSRVAIVGGGMLGTNLALRYRQAGRIVTVFEAAERFERRGHYSIASRDRVLLSLLDELSLSKNIRWDAQGRFGALTGGRAQIIQALRERVSALDVDFRVGATVRAVSSDGSGFSVDAGSEAGEFDEVVLTVPLPVAQNLLAALPDREKLAFQGVRYVGMVHVSFVLNRALKQRYITRAMRGGDQFTLLHPGALVGANERQEIVYVTRALDSQDKMFEASDRHVIEHFARALPGNAEIVTARVMRMPHAFADRQLHAFTSSIAGLSIVNAAHMGAGPHHLERTAALVLTAFRTLCAERIITC